MNHRWTTDALTCIDLIKRFWNFQNHFIFTTTMHSTFVVSDRRWFIAYDCCRHIGLSQIFIPLPTSCSAQFKISHGFRLTFFFLFGWAENCKFMQFSRLAPVGIVQDVSGKQFHFSTQNKYGFRVSLGSDDDGAHRGHHRPAGLCCEVPTYLRCSKGYSCGSALG